MTKRWKLCGFFALTAASCGGPEYDIDTAEESLTTTMSGTYSGTMLLTNSLLNPTKPLGIYDISGIYSGVGPNGTSLGGGATASGAVITGYALLGQTLVGTLASGAAVSLRIDGVVLGTGKNSNVFYYDVKQRSGSNWVPLCGTSNSGIITAIAAPGHWDTRSGVSGGGAWLKPKDNDFTFACRGSTIAKCVEMGYKSSVVDSSKKPTLLLACVRALRADYCGDGRSWTTSGRIIEVWDNKAINSRTMTTWRTEAGWTDRGASCLGTARNQWPTVSAKPGCIPMLENTNCATTGNWLLMNSFQ